MMITNIELKIYELLGIKIFKKIALKIIYIMVMPFTREMTKAERLHSLRSNPSNYYIGNYDIKNLKRFKKMLWINALIHAAIMLSCLRFLFVDINNLASSNLIAMDILFSVLNGYCIILQRYNYIRVNKILKRKESKMCEVQDTC